MLGPPLIEGAAQGTGGGMKRAMGRFRAGEGGAMYTMGRWVREAGFCSYVSMVYLGIPAQMRTRIRSMYDE